MRTTTHLTSRLVLALVPLSFAPSAVAQRPGYSLDLPIAPAVGTGASHGYGIGADGTVVGSSVTYGSLTLPTLWSATGAQRIGLYSGTQGWLRAVNASGVVVGGTNGLQGERGFLWRGGVLVPLTAPGNDQGQPFDISDSGVVVGSGVTNGYLRAVSWDLAGNPTFVPLPPSLGSAATAINEAGLMVGYLTQPDGCYRGFRYDGSAVELLAPLPGDECSVIADVNDHGVATGHSRSEISWTFATARAVVWTPQGVEVLPSLNDSIKVSAGAINNHGQVLGAAGPVEFLYQDGEVWTLDELFHRDGWAYSSAYDLNDRGQIVGVGVGVASSQAFVLTPCLANLDRDPHLDDEDFALFYRAYEAGAELADVDGDGDVDGDDEVLFLQAFASGC